MIVDDLIVATPDHLVAQRTQFIRGERSLDEHDGLALAQHLGFKVDVADPDGLPVTHSGILAALNADNNRRPYRASHPRRGRSSSGGATQTIRSPQVGNPGRSFAAMLEGRAVSAVSAGPVPASDC